MTQRSATNQRNQKHGKPVGVSRKSAASAKPKRAGATSSAAKSSKSGAKGRTTMAFVPTPEYTKWRNLWWWIAGTGAAIAAAYLIYQPIFHQEVPRQWAFPGILVAWGFIAVAIWLDFAKVRPARERAMVASALAGGKPAKQPARAEKNATSVASQEDSSNTSDSSDTDE